MLDLNRLEQIFSGARERAQGERQAYLEGACGDDATLLARVQELLNAEAEAEQFLETAEATPALNAHSGQRVGPYKLLELLGEGGFGSVWMAEQRQPVKRRVALKIIKLGMDTQQVIARFEAERQALALMDHPNIARVLDAGSTDQGRPYFVMELVRGVPILEYCDTERLVTEERLRLFNQVCRAIQHAHQKGIIHRDIKPSNVLVTLHDGNPVVKVIDFGIAKATNSELTTKTLFTQHRQMIGTPAYMSPEQAEMSGLDIDTRSDVYSLGVLLYELLTGTTPFCTEELQKAGLAEMMRIIRETEPPRPSTRLSTLGQRATNVAAHRRADAGRLGLILRGDLDWIVMKCLEKDRTRRYETANGLAVDIERHLNDEPVSASPPSASYRLQKFVRRNRSGVLAGSAVALTLILGVVGTSLGMMWALDQKQRAQMAEEKARVLRSLFGGKTSLAVLPLANRGDAEDDYFANGVTSSLIDDLSRIKTLRVVSELSTRSAVERDLSEPSLLAIARNLKVDGVVTGVVEERQGRVRLKVQLIHALTNQNLWEREYDEKLEDLELLQHKVSQHIASELQLELTSEERDRLESGRSINPEVLTAYMKGLHKLRVRTSQSSRRALEFFETAIKIDPTFAPAIAGKARAYTTIENQFARPHDIMPLAREAALDAIELDPSLPEAHTALGHVKMNYDWDWDAAAAAFKKAIDLNPDFAEGYVGYAMYSAAMNRPDDVIEYLEKALEADPMCIVTAPEGGVYVAAFMVREYEYARELCETAIDLDPGYWGHHTWYALVLASTGDLEGAMEEAELAERIARTNLEVDPNDWMPPLVIAVAGNVAARAGNTERARAAQRELDQMQTDDQFVCPYEAATINIALGEIEEAFARMAEAVKERSACIPWLQVDDRLDPIRSDERFKGLLESTGHVDLSR